MEPAVGVLFAVLVEPLEHPLPSRDRAVRGHRAVVLAGDGRGVIGMDADGGGRPGDLGAAVGMLVASGEDRLTLGPPATVGGASPFGEDDVELLVVG